MLRYAPLCRALFTRRLSAFRSHMCSHTKQIEIMIRICAHSLELLRMNIKMNVCAQEKDGDCMYRPEHSSRCYVFFSLRKMYKPLIRRKRCGDLRAAV